MNKGIPKYLILENDILEDIKSGKLKPGDKIAPESVLKKKYNISTITVRKAFNDLINAGYLYGIQGLGTFVSKAQINRNATALDFYKDLTDRGIKTKLEILEISKCKDKKIRSILEVDEDDVVYCIPRIRYSNGEPIAYQTSYITGLSEKDIKKCKNIKSFYAYLRNYNLEPSWVKETYSTKTISDKNIYLALKQSKDTPCFFAERIGYDEYDKPIEYAETYFEKDNYSVTVTIKHN